MTTSRSRTAAPTVFSIPTGLPFADTLAASLLRDGPLGGSGGDPLALARTLIFVPTRRAARALGDALIRASGAKATLLPRIRPFGDLDDDEAGLAAPLDLVPDDLPPPVSPLRRELILMRLVMAWDQKRRPAPERRSADECARLARALARFIDELDSERVDASKLKGLAPERFAAHWQEVVEFLSIVTEGWPGALKRLGLSDPIAHRNRMLERLAAHWRASPPTHRVIAAGSTGSLPATADLIDAISRAPKGCVVLPGLDQTLDDAGWEQIEPSHPQYGLKKLLERLQVPRRAVPSLGAALEPRRAARLALLSEALRPAESTDAWRALEAAHPEALDGMTLAACANEDAEAGVITLKLREAIETPGRTAALVTPDRGLARRVAAHLGRYAIEVDDSAGRPLALTPPGTFLRQVVGLLAESVAPVPLLALLKHPLAATGRAPAECRRLARLLEIASLRGPRPEAGFVGLRAALADNLERGTPERALDAWIDELATTMAPLEALLSSPTAALSALLKAHVSAAERLATSHDASGPVRLWAGEAGEAAAGFVADLAEAAEDLPPIAPASYPPLFEALMAGQIVRPARPRHARIFIWSPLEARLQAPDLVVLGGLNEGTWPAEPEPDPWLSRPMREAIGLSTPERRIGLSAHDFIEGCGAPEVMITRARRVSGAPTVAARWLSRLDALLSLVAPKTMLDRGLWQHWHAVLDAPERVTPCAPPAPRPPLAARPRQSSVTEIETWLRNPYAIYARRVLSLRVLDPIDAEADAADRGTLIHQVLDEFRRTHPATLPNDARARLIALGKERFTAFAHRPAAMAFWWPRFERIASWFIAHERSRAELDQVLATECSGTLELDAPGGKFLIAGKADRIDRLTNGSYLIIDYKTGTTPAKKDVTDGPSVQLPLEAVMLMAGKFKTLAWNDAAIGLAFWQLSGGRKPGEVVNVTTDARDLARRVRDEVRALIAAFDDPSTPYRAVPRPWLPPAFNDYAHLARIGEWRIESPS